MEKEITSRVLKLSGKVEIPEDLDLDIAYKILFDGEIRSKEDGTDDAGGIIRTFKFIPITGQIIGEEGKITKIKDARKKSQQLRAVIRREWIEKQDSRGEEDYYNFRMGDIMSKIINGEI